MTETSSGSRAARETRRTPETNPEKKTAGPGATSR